MNKNVTFTRRNVLKRITVGAAVVGWSTASGEWAVAGADTTGVARLPRLDGTLVTDPAVLTRFSHDFGHLVTESPWAVLRPGSVGDIVEMVRYARINGLTIAVNGQGGNGADDLESHSNYGQAAVPGGISIDAKSLSTIHSIGANSAWVDTGVTWAQLIDATLPRGLMPPSHTDYQHLSIGGTLSVGGVGGQVQKYGLQVDTVSEIEIVTGRGYVVRASARENADLFNAALAGGGQVGIITKARVRLVAAPARAALFSLYYDDPAVYFADQEKLLRDGRFDYQAGGPVRNAEDTAWRYLIDVVAYHDGTPPDRAALLAGLRDDRASATFDDLPFRDWVFRLDAIEQAAKEGGFWDQPHPWLSLVLPRSTVAEFTRQVMAELTSADLGVGFSFLYPFLTSKLTKPLFKVPDEPVVYLFDLLRLPFPDDPGVAGMLAQNRRFYDLAVSLGGTRYLIGAIPDMTPREWRGHFGGDWFRLVAAKRAYDPDHVLTPGQGFFG
ncbi:oxygen-dependent FAD-linked oxidoreductase [Actinophytocola xinjiangensis]|uniref:Oxygen-dependent FAD-linked oxidoreductase n=1 Tax=Actinophytocola xinjiangensis TaxID=485602 RepID=A0A7Z0WHG9_9PSEU|nr:FAD-binding protein [Actinophytocola xinjiangensis]OLF06615.1 oxygen-dependent FAD-linked oxidoreductase [Actinophytocola xinjiangensis]